MSKALVPPTAKRVRFHTKEKINQMIKDKTLKSINKYVRKSEEEITERILELNGEWDIERALETSASSFVIVGVIFGFLFHPKWFAFAGIIGVFLLEHAIEGWCPPLPLFRRMGIRTASEIDEEKVSLKYLRGDFTINGNNAEELLKRTKMS